MKSCLFDRARLGTLGNRSQLERGLSLIYHAPRQETVYMSTKRDLISITDLGPDETLEIIRRAEQMKAEACDKPLANKSVALLFEQSSLRTRTSFQVGIHELGGYSVYLNQEEVGLGTREPVADIAHLFLIQVYGEPSK